MLVFPSQLVPPAKKAGMKVPPGVERNPEAGWDSAAYPHFTVFANFQLCRAMSDLGQQWDNAEIIAKVPAGEIDNVTVADLVELGCRL